MRFSIVLSVMSLFLLVGCVADSAPSGRGAGPIEGAEYRPGANRCPLINVGTPNRPNFVVDPACNRSSGGR